MAQRAGERESSRGCSDSHLGSSSGPYRPLVTSKAMCCLLEISVHSPLPANPICFSRGNSCIHCPTLLFSPGRAPLARASLLWRCWAEVLAAIPAHEGILAGGSTTVVKEAVEKQSQASNTAAGPFSSSGFLFLAPCLAGAALPGAPTMLAGPSILPSRRGTSGAN